MAVTPYPIPASPRKTPVLTGNGGTTYGPFGEGWGVFDIADVQVMTKAQGDAAFAPASVTVAKVNPAAVYSTFTITFATAIPSTTQFQVTGLRAHKREVAVTKGTTINARALEAELSKIAVVEQEQRRDLDDLAARSFAIPPGSSASAAAVIASVLRYDLRFLPPTSGPPTTRIDGSPLQAGDEWFNTATGARNIRYNDAWVPATANNGGGNTGVNYAPGTAAGEVVVKQQLDAITPLEGTFTPVLMIGTAAQTALEASGYYTRVGKTIFFQAIVRVDAISNVGIDGLSLEGLPFVAVDDASGRKFPCSVSISQQLTPGRVSGRVIFNQVSFRIQKFDGSRELAMVRSDLALAANIQDVIVHAHGMYRVP
jgi:hypothetical protein